MNTFMNGLKNATNYTLTENGGIAHKSTNSKLYDMFALGGAFRSRSDADVITLFKDAYAENPVYALKCLFYLGDCRGGAGERRFFRLCYRWLAQNDIEAARRNLEHIPLYRRWDDLYCLEGTKLESEMFQFMKKQLVLDMQSKTPSLLAKWLKSCNTSSAESRRLGEKTRLAFGMTQRQYRKTLSVLRERINVLERLMSAGKWDEIEFDKIPSRAGMIYKNAFARHDIERAKSEKEVQTYEQFAKSDAKVNSKVLYPYECVAAALKCRRSALDDTNRLMTNKYWENLPDIIKNANFNGIVVADTSGSMTGSEASAPINVAISLALYCAERASGPYAGHYISFASRPQLIETSGVDFVDKVKRIYDTNLIDNTNLEAVFDLLLDTAQRNRCKQEDIPQNVVIVSDMQIDAARGSDWSYYNRNTSTKPVATEMDIIRNKWAVAGYKMPKLYYWNVNARDNTILDDGPDVSYVSGFSQSIFENIMTGKTGYTLMMDKLDSDRYAKIK